MKAHSSRKALSWLLAVALFIFSVPLAPAASSLSDHPRDGGHRSHGDHNLPAVERTESGRFDALDKKLYWRAI